MLLNGFEALSGLDHPVTLWGVGGTQLAGLKACCGAISFASGPQKVGWGVRAREGVHEVGRDGFPWPLRRLPLDLQYQFCHTP